MKKITVLMIIMSLITGCTNNKTIDKIQPNKDNIIMQNQEINGILFTNISLVNEDDSAIFNITLSNNTTSTITLTVFNILIKDIDDNIMISIPVYIGDNIYQNESKDFSTNIDRELKDAYGIEIVI